MTEPVPDTPPSVAVEVTDHDGEQIRIRAHRPDERRTVAALEYRHDGSDEWVHVVALDPEDLARLSDFARILVWASQHGQAGADLRAALYGSTPVAPGPTPPVGVQRVGGERTIREDWQERRPGEPFPLDRYEELQGVPTSTWPVGSSERVRIPVESPPPYDAPYAHALDELPEDDAPLAPPLTHAHGGTAETACGISYADEPGIPLASDCGGVSCPACLAVGGER